MKKFVFIAIVLMIAVSGVSQGLTDLPSDTVPQTLDLTGVVISATLTPKSLMDVPVQTQVITEEEIRRTDATNVQELLRQEMPGVEFSYAMNQQVNLNLAGFAGQNVLFLIDGERLAGETMDNIDFSRLTMSNVKRIEVVRGAASALYGSNATGGVINIITKEADKKWTANVGVRYGSHNEWRANASLGMKFKHISNNIDFSFNTIETYDVCDDLTDECDFRHVYGFSVYNLSDKFVARPTDNLKLTARAGYFFKERLYNPDIPDRYRDYSGSLRGEWDITDKDHLELSYAYDQYDKSDYLVRKRLDIRDYSNRQHAARTLYHHTFGAPKRGKVGGGTLTAGADLLHDYLDSYQFAEGEVHSQLTADIFTQYDWEITPSLELLGAVRWDYFSDGNKSRLTPKLNLRYKVKCLTLRAGYAQGFRAPTLKEKYMDFDMASIFNIRGNAGLKAETSHNLNLSAECAFKGYNFSVSGNCNFVRDRISTSSVRYDEAHKPYIDYINIDRLRVFGLEATARANWKHGLSASIAYVFTYEESVGGTVTQYCPARPHSLTARFSWNKWWNKHFSTDLSLSGRFLSTISYESMYMYEPFEAKPVHDPAYTLWKIQVVQGFLNNSLKLTVAVDNIFNYRPKVYSFNAPLTTGTSFQVGLSYSL